MSHPSPGNSALPPPPRNVFCGNCGNTVQPGAAICLGCGFVPRAARNFCQNCGIGILPGQAMCTRCGFAVSGGRPAMTGEKSKVAAGLLAIFFGGIGVHKFYLGYHTAGIILLGTTLAGICLSLVVIGLFFVWIPGTIALIEGIIYLTKSDTEFHDTYVANKREWF